MQIGIGMKKNDFILIGGIVLLALLIWLGSTFIQNKPGSFVVVTVNGTVYQTFRLAEDLIVDIPSVNGSNSLVIKNGSAFISHASCSDLICVSHKPIHTVGESIICLPNRVVIEITGESESDFDMIVY